MVLFNHHPHPRHQHGSFPLLKSPSLTIWSEVSSLPRHTQATASFPALCILRFIIILVNYIYIHVFAVLCIVVQSCLTLCNSTDCSLPGPSVHGDSPGKNTRVGCHALLQGNLPNPGMEPRSPTLQANSLPSEPPGKPKNTGVGSLSLLSGTFSTQELNQGLLHCRKILYQLSYQGNPNYIYILPRWWIYMYVWASLVAQLIKSLPAMQETWVWSLSWEDPLEKGMATHFSILAWRIPWTEKPGGLQSMGSKRVGHDWTANTFTFIYR